MKLAGSIRLLQRVALAPPPAVRITETGDPPITALRRWRWLDACFRIPKEEFKRLLKNLLEELEATETGYSARARLMVTGSVLTNPELSIR
jgi:hypothetical protein